MTSLSMLDTAQLTDRVIGRIRGSAELAPTLICLGALHGNEPAGAEAAKRVLARLRQDGEGIVGEVVALLGNRRALAKGRRFLAHDLNRAWTSEHLAGLRAADGSLAFEDLELVELEETLREISAEASGRLYLIDLHTTSGPSPAFTILDDTLENRSFALGFPVPLVLGLEEELEGTLLSYLAVLGVTNLGFEGGQHDDPASVERAEAAIWVALESCGVLSPGRPEVAAARFLLAAASRGLPYAVEAWTHHPISPGDGFEMSPGFISFQRVSAGQMLARDRRGPILAPESALILMPLYQWQGEDGFFLAREIRSWWLKLSVILRRLRLERLLHLLPGVRRNPERPGSILVDRWVARWLAPEICRLLGFRRCGEAGRSLVLSRRV